MTEKPYTDADVEMLAIVQFDADQRHLVATSPNPAALEPTPWSLPILAHIRETYRNRARAGLDALAAAGRLAASPGCCTATVGAHQHSESCRVPVAGAVAGATPTTTTEEADRA